MAKDTKKPKKTKKQLEYENGLLRHDLDFYYNLVKIYIEALELIVEEQQIEDTDAWYEELFDKVAESRLKQNKNQGEN